MNTEAGKTMKALSIVILLATAACGTAAVTSTPDESGDKTTSNTSPDPLPKNWRQNVVDSNTTTDTNTVVDSNTATDPNVPDPNEATDPNQGSNPNTPTVDMSNPNNWTWPVAANRPDDANHTLQGVKYDTVNMATVVAIQDPNGGTAYAYKWTCPSSGASSTPAYVEGVLQAAPVTCAFHCLEAFLDLPGDPHHNMKVGHLTATVTMVYGPSSDYSASEWHVTNWANATVTLNNADICQ